MKKIFFALLVMVCFAIITQRPADAGSACDFRQEDMPVMEKIPENFTRYWVRNGYAYSIAIVPAIHDREKQERIAKERAYATLVSNFGKKVKEKDAEVWRKWRNPDDGKSLLVIRTPLNPGSIKKK
jgi:hypothetical protein